MYYNTTNETGKLLQTYVDIAKCQNDAIRYILINNPCGLTPFDIQEYWMKSTPITSIRRSLNTLVNEGVLVKSNEKRLGKLGRLNHVWKLNIYN